jgi:hypothetical protein
MTHAATRLERALLVALRADPALKALVGASIYEAPPPGGRAPDIALIQHDLSPRDADLVAGHEHRLVFQLRASGAAKKPVHDMAERIAAVLAALVPADIAISLRRLDTLETSVDAVKREANGRLVVRLFSDTP